MEMIQDDLRDTDFSEELEAFQTLKRRLPEFWAGVWKDFKISPYLNDRDMKEFVIGA